VLERRADSAVQPAKLVSVETGRRSQRVEPRPPQRLVDVDIPHPRERALVEESRFQRRTTTFEAFAEAGSREESVERLVPHPCCEVRLRLSRLEQKPGAEAPHIAVRDIRAVV
jgi:hypothetical protein